MKNVKIAFNTQDNDQPIPVGYTEIRCHMIFYVKMQDFRHKARENK